jgi:hypothetical protein
MRTNILLAADGTLLNPNQNYFIKTSPINGNAGYTQFQNQITACFYNEVTQLENGLYVPTKLTVIKTGLSGTIQIKAFAADDAPYSTDITPTDSINIASACILQFYGIVESLDITCTGITGAAYINLLVDRSY